MTTFFNRRRRNVLQTRIYPTAGATWTVVVIVAIAVAVLIILMLRGVL